LISSLVPTPKYAVSDRWFDIALGGSLRKIGPVSFAKELSRKAALALSPNSRKLEGETNG